MMKRDNKFFDLKSKKFQLIILSIISLLLSTFIERIFFENSSLSIDRIIIFFMITIFIGLHFILNIKKMYDFIYRKRYYIGFIFLAFVMLNKYHISSVSYLDNYIQPNIKVEGSLPVLGESRAIRSDEWLVSTPTLLSQASSSVKFSNTNNLMMARESNVNMFPQLPTKNISSLSNVFTLGFLVFDTETAFSFWWFSKLLVLFFSSFELAMLITKGKRLYSLLGAVLITFSPVMQWWSIITMVIFGQIAILLINLLLKEKVKLKKVIYSILVGIAGSGYIISVYPAWMIPFGYVFLGLLIWILHNNKQNIHWKDIFYLLIIIFSIFIIVYPAYTNSSDVIAAMTSTVYPGERFSTGGYGWQNLFGYFSNIFFSFKTTGNPSECSQFFGFFPIPIILGIYYIIKNFKKQQNDFLLNTLIFLSILIGFWNFVELPTFLAKYSLLYMSTPGRSQIVVGYICIFLLILLLSKYENNKINIKRQVLIIILSIILCYIGVTISDLFIPGYMTTKMVFIVTILFATIFYLILSNYSKYNKILSIGLIILLLVIGGTVNPIGKGLKIIYEKPFAKEIQNIVKKDPNATWIVVDSDIITPNYILANGAKVINSTNYYPNIDLWKKIDPDSSNIFVYNRYAHVAINLTIDKTLFNLIQSDLFILNLNKNDICKLNPNYIVSKKEILDYNTSLQKIETIYSEDNIIISKIICK